jgi:hypothetical protein
LHKEKIAPRAGVSVNLSSCRPNASVLLVEKPYITQKRLNMMEKYFILGLFDRFLLRFISSDDSSHSIDA